MGSQNRAVAPARLGGPIPAGLSLLTGLGAGLLGYALLHEPMDIGFERLTVRIEATEGELPEQGLRILHLSDTHFQGRARQLRERRKIARIVRLTQGLDYDLLVHTGDFIHYDSGLENVLALLDALPAPRLGRFAVLGNHDYSYYAMRAMLPTMWQRYRDIERRGVYSDRELLARPWEMINFGRYLRQTPVETRRSGYNDAAGLRKALLQRGFQVLHNRSVHIRHAAIDFYLAGVDDVSEGRPHLHNALDGVPPRAPTILLSHNPDILRSPRVGQADLVLAGHTHGGQIVLPFWGPAHTQARYLERRDVAGYLRRGRTQVYITRGIGEGIPLRFAAKPQIGLITVLGEKAGRHGT
ncbi:MAG: metallophosphoesterase [Caldilineaceae bacterium]|nr:metallophosphoesterase [Caldilineaceae bacterium]